MFAQYNLDDPNPTAAQIQATTSTSVEGLDAAGRGQVEIPDNTNIMASTLDLTQIPITLVAVGG